MSKKISYKKLNSFFKEVADLALNHDILKDSAVIYASELGEALERVDPEWWKNYGKD